MTTPTPSTHVRQPAGTPVGGQFAGKTPSLPEVTLSRADTSLLSIGMGELPDELPQVTTERNRRMRYTASAAVAAALAGALTFSLVSCASPSDGAAPAPSVTASETAAPELPQFAAGSTLTQLDADALLAAKGETRAFQLEDGSWVAVNVNEPLPAVVQDSLNRSSAAVIAANPFDANDTSAASMDRYEAIQAIPGTIRAATGKRAIVIDRTFGSWEGPDATPRDGYALVGTRDSTGYASQDEAIAAAQQYIAGQTNPSEWAIVIGF